MNHFSHHHVISHQIANHPCDPMLGKNHNKMMEKYRMSVMKHYSASKFTFIDFMSARKPNRKHTGEQVRLPHESMRNRVQLVTTETKTVGCTIHKMIIDSYTERHFFFPYLMTNWSLETTSHIYASSG